ncbi:hypothetical protein GJ744_001315 [Endocarpon pusillum]|uniref:Uncharacterized protein n=1 Tax=Endocarpon pusillum TaxID=364733 RepID=A0A8H7A3R4_9EURO|nr:hypothetical protein GJ744_001315 [Endocarpon pusillum]
MDCSDFALTREDLFNCAGTRNYAQMLATAKGAKAAARWLQGQNLLPQFRKGLGADLPSADTE